MSRSSLERACNLRVGQRVRVLDDDTRIADVHTLSSARWGRADISFCGYNENGDAEYFTIDADWSEWRGDSIVQRLPGKPYLPGIDPPRGMRRGTGTDRDATPSILPPPPTTPEEEVPPVTTVTTTGTIPMDPKDLAALLSRLTGTPVSASSMVVLPTGDPSGESGTTAAAYADVTVEPVSGSDEAVAPVTEEASTKRTRQSRAKKRGAIEDILSKYYTPDTEPHANVLLASPPSFGKSYAIRKVGQSYDVFLEHGCSDDMDEINTLLGSPVPDGKGGFVMVDGVLTEAVRHAAAGRTVLLLLDEVLRLSSRAQEWLLTFLTGVKNRDGTRKYRLRTRRAMPDGTLEVVECPAKRFHVVAATNLSILSPIEAFWSRWETVRIEFSVQLVAETAESILRAAGFKADTGTRRFSKLFARLMKDSRSAVADGTIRFPVDLRMLERAAHRTDSRDIKATAQLLAESISGNVANWNPDTGNIAAESEAAVVGWRTSLLEFNPDNTATEEA